MIRAALIGFGGIAKSHRRAFRMLEESGLAKLVCAYDVNPEAFTRNTKINNDSADVLPEEHINYYTDLDEMIKNESFELVDICIPSYLHKEMTIRMLNHGYHVMCEKPMSLSYADSMDMVRAAKENGKELMIGQCVRFYPAFEFVKEAIDDGRFGKVTSAHLQRLSAPPTWGWENWFLRPECSGGCLTDMHIHDVDLARYLFGEPDAVRCMAHSSVSIHDSAHTTLKYGDMPITIIGDWELSGFRFAAISRISFERATVVYDTKTLTVYPKDGTEPYEVDAPLVSSQYNELSYLINIINSGKENTKNPPESAAKSVRVIELLRESIANGGEFVRFEG